MAQTVGRADLRTMPLPMLRPLQTAYPPGVERRLQAVTIRQPLNIEE